MNPDERKHLVREFHAHYDAGDLAAMAALLRPDMVVHGMPGVPPGRAGFLALSQQFLTAFPDVQTTVEDVVAEGDKVVVRWTAQGTHQGAFFGVPGSGLRVTAQAIEIWRVADGQLAELWTQVDLLGMLQQVGAIPAPAGA
jgi:steroid delta-isomerase-like uncharacterized protein